MRVTPLEPLGGEVIGLPAASWKSRRERRTRLIEPSSWANLMTSAWVGKTPRITISCWPLSDVWAFGLPVVVVGGAWPLAGAAGGGSWRQRTCIPSRRSLTLVPFRPLTTVIVPSVPIVVTGNLSAVKPTSMSM